MSAPDRIHAVPSKAMGWKLGYCSTAHEGTEYIRADLVPQWQPIETAPKDGTVILIYEPSYLGVDSGTIYTASWDCDYYNTWIEAGGERYMSFDDATHWMPLPSPPPAS